MLADHCGPVPSVIYITDSSPKYVKGIRHLAGTDGQVVFYVSKHVKTGKTMDNFFREKRGFVHSYDPENLFLVRLYPSLNVADFKSSAVVTWESTLFKTS